MVDITEHLGLVHWVIQRTFRWSLGPRIEEEDLVQAGRMGLMRAAQTFDPEKGAFTTYAVPWVQNFIRRHIEYRGRLVRVPSCVQRGGKAGPERLRSLDMTECPQLAARSTEHSDWANRHDVQTLLALIPNLRQRQVVEAYYLRERTLDEIAAPLGVTRERARQLREKGLAAVRKLMKRGSVSSP